MFLRRPRQVPTAEEEDKKHDDIDTVEGGDETTVEGGGVTAGGPGTTTQGQKHDERDTMIDENDEVDQEGTSIMRKRRGKVGIRPETVRRLTDSKELNDDSTDKAPRTEFEKELMAKLKDMQLKLNEQTQRLEHQTMRTRTSSRLWIQKGDFDCTKKDAAIPL